MKHISWSCFWRAIGIGFKSLKWVFIACVLLSSPLLLLSRHFIHNKNVACVPSYACHISKTSNMLVGNLIIKQSKNDRNYIIKPTNTLDYWRWRKEWYVFSFTDKKLEYCFIKSFQFFSLLGGGVYPFETPRQQHFDLFLISYH